MRDPGQPAPGAEPTGLAQLVALVDRCEARAYEVRGTHLMRALAGLPPLVDGAVTVDDTPGWGVAIRDDWLAGRERGISEA